MSSPHSRRRAQRPVGCALGLAALLLLAGVAAPNLARASAEPVRAETMAPRFAAFVAEAAQRFGLPEDWIWRVMQAESARNPRAVSRAGAMGLMQVMPATWAELRRRHALGGDPFDPRDNILAGAAYLREMFDRFGAPGFLAAYNAGPARYADHLASGRPLPRETIAYLDQLAPAITGAMAPPGPSTSTRSVDWMRAELFVARSPTRREDAAAVASRMQAERSPSAAPSSSSARPSGSADALFVAVASRGD